MNRKEIAKFASGAEAFHALAHATLWLSGTTLTVFGIRVPPKWHLSSAIINATISVALGTYAWRRLGRVRPVGAVTRVSPPKRVRPEGQVGETAASMQGTLPDKLAPVGRHD